VPSYLRSYRLVSKHDFQFVFDKPSRVTQKFILALFKPNQQSVARLGIIIGKRHVKRAVDRNLLRRLIRESFRHLQAQLKGLDIIVLMRSEWCPLGTRIWRNEIDNLWQLLINSSLPH
jgi:ribonuclease P protein component